MTDHERMDVQAGVASMQEMAEQYLDEDQLYGYAEWPSEKDYLEERAITYRQAQKLLKQLGKDHAKAEVVSAVVANMKLDDLRRVTPKRTFYLLRLAELITHMPKDRRLREPATAKALADLYSMSERQDRANELIGYMDQAVSNLKRANWNSRRAIRNISTKEESLYKLHYISSPHILEQLAQAERR